MNDIRLYRRSTLLSLAGDDETWTETIDGLEVVDPIGHPDSSRFILLPAGSPLQLPACSFINRSSDEPWMIWTGLELDEGAVYIGKSDFHEMARVAGYVPESAISNSVRDKEILAYDLSVALDTISSLRGAIADLVGAPSQVRVSSRTESDRENEDREGREHPTGAITDVEIGD